MGKTITVTGHETLSNDNGDTFILEGKGASLTIEGNSRSHFIMAGSNQTLTFAYGATTNNSDESVAIKGTHDTIVDGHPGDPATGFMNIAGFAHTGSQVISDLAWDVQYQGYTGPDGMGGYDYYNGLGTTFDFMGDSNIKETAIGSAGHLISLTNG